MAKEIADIVANLGGSMEPPVFEAATPEEGAATTTPTTPASTASATPAATPAGDPPNTETPFDVFGEPFKDKGWVDVKSDYEARVKRAQELESELAEVQSRVPEFADPEIAQYNSWVKNGGIKDYSLFSRIKSVGTETSDIDALVLKRIAENPSFIGMESRLKADILKDFPIEGTVENPLSDEDIAFNKAKISAQAQEARQYLNTLQSKLQVPAAVTPTDKAALVEKRKGDWSAATETMFSQLNTIPLQRMVKEGDKEKLEKVLDYQIPDHLIQAAKQRVIEYFPNHADVSPEILKTVQASVMQSLVFENLPHILNTVLDAERARWQEEADKLYGGGILPKSPGGVGNAVGPTDVVSGAKQHFKNL